MTESYKLIKNNGSEIFFQNGEWFFKSLPNFGNPDIQYSTQKAYYMDGEVITNFSLSPRQISLPLVTNSELIKTRLDYWNLRKELLSFLSPVEGAMRFQIVLDDHITYELTNVYPTNGLSMEGNTFSENRNDGRVEEVLRLTAYDPVWRVADINTTGELTPVESEDLVFPFEFPFVFGSGGGQVNQTISYVGTWRSYPRITITGPYNTCSLTNKQNDANITLIQAISSGEKRIIDLTDPIEGFTVKDLLGQNKMGDVNLSPNFTQFYFVPNATNGIDAILNGSSGSSKVEIEYYTKYLGI